MPVVLVIGGLICAAALFAHRRWNLTWQVLGIVVIGAGMAATCALALWLRLETRDAHPLSGMSGKATVTMSIRDDPRNFGPAQRGQVTTRVTVLAVGERRVPSAIADVVARAPGWVGLLPGQHVRVLASIRAPRGGDLSVARLTASGPPAMLGRPPPLQRGAGVVRATLQQNSAQALSGESAGLLPGLVIGDESALSEDVRDQFRAAGLSHLTAVSGANFALTCGAAIALIRLIGGSPKVAAVSGVVVIVGFVVLVRPSPSVLRAAMMGGVGLLALLSTRRARAVPALGVAVIGGLLWWPELASAPGFALSVVATAGLVLIAPSIRDTLREWRIPPVVAEVLAIAIAAQVVTAPLIAMISGTFNVVSILANVVVAPVVGVISVVGDTRSVDRPRRRRGFCGCASVATRDVARTVVDDHRGARARRIELGGNRYTGRACRDGACHDVHRPGCGAAEPARDRVGAASCARSAQRDAQSAQRDAQSAERGAQSAVGEVSGASSGCRGVLAP